MRTEAGKKEEVVYYFGRETGLKKVDVFGWSIQDKPGVLMDIHKDELIVNPAYQRSLNIQKVREYTKNWSWIACNVISVAHRDGICYVMDGQHRVIAAKKRADIATLPCVVFESNDVIEEAKGFLAINTNRKPLNTRAKFKAMVCSQDTSALLVSDLISKSGRIINDCSDNTSVRCIGLLTKWSKRNPVLLQNMWSLLTELLNGHIFHGKVVAGLLELQDRLDDNFKLYEGKLKERVLNIGYDILLAEIMKASILGNTHGSAVEWARALLGAINKGLRNKLETKRTL